MRTQDLAPTVVIGFAEALAAPEALWSLRSRGYRVVAFARKGRHSALHHSRLAELKEFTAPEEDYAASVAQLATLLDSVVRACNGAPVAVLPLDDVALRMASSLPEDGHPWKLAGPSGSGSAVALDKQLQLHHAAAAGFAVPSAVSVESVSGAEAVMKSRSFPVILKSTDCAPVREGRIRKGKHWICANQAELNSALEAWGAQGPAVLQDFIEGTGEGIFGIASGDGFGTWTAHRRIRMMNPHGSGSSACVSQPVDSEAQRCAERMLTRIGWRGLFMIELLRDRAGKLWFVELNGRPWGSTALSRRQGLEYPAWQVGLSLGEDLPRIAPPDEPVICRHAGRELMHLLFVLRGSKSKAIHEWPGFWRTLADVFRVGRRHRFYNWCSKDPMVFLADCYYTVHDNLLKSGRSV